jgi:hypothetical protein
MQLTSLTPVLVISLCHHPAVIVPRDGPKPPYSERTQSQKRTVVRASAALVSDPLFTLLEILDHPIAGVKIE